MELKVLIQTGQRLLGGRYDLGGQVWTAALKKAGAQKPWEG